MCVYIYLYIYIYLAKLYFLAVRHVLSKRETRSFLSKAEAEHVSTLTRALAKCRGQLELKGKLEELSSIGLQLSAVSCIA